MNVKGILYPNNLKSCSLIQARLWLSQNPNFSSCLGIIAYLIFCWSVPLESTVETLLSEAAIEYKQGEKATAFHERKNAFNRALYLYHLAEQQITPTTPSLNQALGDTYFQLQEYPWALLYYQRALQNGFGNKELNLRARDVAAQLGVSFPFDSFPFKLRCFVSYSSLVWIGLLLFAVATMAIWFPRGVFRQLAIIAVVAFSMLAGSCWLLQYLSPVTGILIAATPIYQAPHWNQPLLDFDPLLAGSTVTIMEITPDGEGLKISTSSSQEGFIPTTHLRLLESLQF